MSRNNNSSTFENDTVPPKPLLNVSTEFGSIASLAICSNLLLCVVITKSSMLKKPYNILIFNLAITDLLTGAFIFATPNYVVKQSLYPKIYGTSAWLFCKLISSRYFLFVFGKASALTVMCLAVERWYSIVKPMQYKCRFSRPRLYLYLVLIWVGCLASQAFHFFQTKPDGGGCVPTYINGDIGQLLIVTNVALTFVIPSIVTWITFAHIWIRLRKPSAVRATRRELAQVRLIRMCALAALLLTVCWLPSQSALVLTRFHVIAPRFNGRFILTLLAFSNSCVNPWVYFLTNQKYRGECRKLLRLKKPPAFPCGVGLTMMHWSKRDSYEVSGADNLSFDAAL